MVINYFIILFALVGLFFGINLEASAYETVCDSHERVELDSTLLNGKILDSCIDDLSPTVFLIVESDVDSQLTVEIPKTMVYAVEQDCTPSFVIIIVGDEEASSTIEETTFSRIFTIDFPKGNNLIEIMGTFTLGDDVHQYCGEIYGYDSQYLSPKKQLDKGRAADLVRCNEGLELIFKYDNTPACVKPQTVEKLIARGWAIS